MPRAISRHGRRRKSKQVANITITATMARNAENNNKPHGIILGLETLINALK